MEGVVLIVWLWHWLHNGEGDEVNESCIEAEMVRRVEK